MGETAEKGRRAVLLPALLLAAVVLLVHGPTLRFGYTWLDDHKLVVESMPLLSDPAFALTAFRDDVFLTSIGNGFYRPLLTLSFMPAAMLTGPAPFLHHLTNVLIHLAAVWLVFVLLRTLVGGTLTPLAAAAVFAVHPALAQAVAWIPGRNDSLLAVFVLLSFLSFLRHREKPGAPVLAAHLVFLLAALLTKETAIVLPVACVVYVAIFERGRPPRATPWAVYLAWIPVAVAYAVARTLAVGLPHGLSEAVRPASIGAGVSALLVAAGHAMLPVGLSVYPTLEGAVLWPGILAVAGAAALIAAATGRDRPRAVFGAAWFTLFLLPTLAKSTAGAEREALDHRIYVGLAGALLLIPFDRLRVKVSGRTLGACAVLGIALLGVRTLAYETCFRDDRSFWRNAAATPAASAFVLNNLGALYFRQDNYAMAEKTWRAAEQRNPSERLVHANLGLLYERAGDAPHAAEQFRKELEVNPQDYTAHIRLGAILYRRGSVPAAVALWDEARGLRPREPAAYTMLLHHFLEMGDRDRAAQLLDLARQYRVPLPRELLEALGGA